jgi:drug/metabolite transporter (DMT)-like permease
VGVVAFAFGPVLIAAADASGPVLVFWRLWIGLPLLGVLSALQIRRSGNHPAWSGWRWTIVSGVAFALHQVTFMTALRQTSVVDVTLMNTLAPLVVAVLAVPLFGERPGVSFRLWSLVAIGGAALVAVAGATGPSGQPLGMLLAASNVVFYAFYFVLSKQARNAIDTWPFLFGTFTVAAVVISVYVLAVRAPIAEVTTFDLLMCLAVAVGPGCIGHFLVTWSLRWVPANIPPVIMLSIPILSGLLAFAFLGQHVTWLQAAGGAFTLLGVLGALRTPGSIGSTAAESLELAEEL